MSDPIIDTVIFILLILSVGFGGIGVIGLVLFPDIRSRMYTAFRATVISISAMVLSGIVLSLFIFQSNGGDQYVTLVIHAIVLLCIAVVANIVIYTIILGRTKTAGSCHRMSDQDDKTDRE